MNNKKIFVLDTNILIHESSAFLSFEEHDVVIPMTVLEELDRIKDRKSPNSHDARHAIKSIEKIFSSSSPEEITNGVALPDFNGHPRGNLSIFSDYKVNIHDANKKTSSLSDQYGGPDNAIIEAAIYLQEVNRDKHVVLVTKDIGMRLKAKKVGMRHVEDFKSDYVVEDIRFLTKGYEKFEGSFWSIFDEAQTNSGKEGTFHKVKKDAFSAPFLNQYLIDDTVSFAGKIIGIEDNHAQIKDIGHNKLMSIKAWGIKPRNIQQGMALDALLDDSTEMVMITGSAGSGKTLLAIAAALEMVIEQGKFDKIIVTRSTPAIAEEIGFLPGTESEKMAPWLAAISDTLEVLHGKDSNADSSISYIIEKANIQYKSLNFMRGRSIQNAIVILDESQNLTPSQFKTIATRCGENTKLICLGNLGQIDSSYITAIGSGLTYAVEKFKNFEGAASINLNGVVRSRLAAYAEENL